MGGTGNKDQHEKANANMISAPSKIPAITRSSSKAVLSGVSGESGSSAQQGIGTSCSRIGDQPAGVFPTLTVFEMASGATSKS